MARMHVPAVAIGFLLFIAAGLSGLLVLSFGKGGGIGLAWAVVVFLGVLVAGLVVAALRSRNTSRVEQP